MGLPVRTRHARAVDAEGHGQFLPADVVNDLVVGALQKGGVDGIVRAHPLRRQRRAQHAGVLFADADVKRAAWKFAEEGTQPQGVRHGGSHRDDAFITPCERRQLLAERRGIFRARFPEGDAVRALGLPLAERKALSLARRNVQQYAPRRKRIFGALQGGQQLLQIVPVVHAHIGESVPLEQCDVLDGRVPLLHLAQQFVRAAHRGRNGHPVIVQNDENAGIEDLQAVERLIDEPVMKGAVADERNDVEGGVF